MWCISIVYCYMYMYPGLFLNTERELLIYTRPTCVCINIQYTCK